MKWLLLGLGLTAALGVAACADDYYGQGYGPGYYENGYGSGYYDNGYYARDRDDYYQNRDEYNRDRNQYYRDRRDNDDDDYGYGPQSK